MRTLTALGAAALGALTGAVQAQDIAPLAALAPFIGDWTSRDGEARTVNEWGLDQRIMHSRMYFAAEDGAWSQVSDGSCWAAPATGQLTCVAVTMGMPVVHFDITGEADETGARWTDIAYTPEGHPMLATETWTPNAAGGWSYEVSRPGEDGAPQRWMGGEWIATVDVARD